MLRAVLAKVLLSLTLATAASLSPRLASWKQPRAGVVQDTLYIHGGEMYMQMWDGSAWVEGTSPATANDISQYQGQLYTLDFSKSFDVSVNYTDLLGVLSSGGLDNDPPFRTGFMFADDYEFYTFGGMSILPQGEEAGLLNDQIFRPHGNIPTTPASWNPDFNTHYLPSGVSRNITHGAGASVPSEYLGFYFSGMETPSGGPIEAFVDIPSVTSAQLVKVDMTAMGSATWESIPLLENVPSRGSGQLPWIPFGTQGLLVTIGGVMNPVDAYGTDYPDNSMKTESDATSPGFMSQLSVYDIASNSWYNQSTTGTTPPQLADFCTVVTHQKGTTSYQIYVYGGNDGTDLGSTPNDDVFILSVPSFTWTKYSPTTSIGGRYGHVCALPYPDQMFVIGGMNLDVAFPEGRWITILNLTSIEWQTSYNPTKWSNYVIPDVVTAQGDTNEFASNMDSALVDLFNTPYPKETIPWYPYKPATTHRNHWLVPVLAGVLGGVGVAVAGFLVWLFLHRRTKRKASSSRTSDTLEPSGNGVNAWRHQIKDSISTTAREIDSSDRSTVRTSQVLRTSQVVHPDTQEVVEIGGGTWLLAAHSPRSPVPQSPTSGSVEVSGDHSRQEMQDASPRQLPLNHAPSTVEQPDYHFRRHPLFPHNANDAMSMSESLISSARPQISSVGADGEPSPQLSYHSMPLVTDNYDQVLYGRVPFPPPERPRSSATARSAMVQQQLSNSQLPYENMYPGDALPSASRERPSGLRHTSNTSSDFQITPLDDYQISLTNRVANAGLHSSTDPASPLPMLDTPATHSRPAHVQRVSDMSSEIQAPSNPLPSPDPDEESRRSVIINALPESPAQSQSSTLWSGMRSPPPLSNRPRRKEVGSPVRSAYDENTRRFPDRESRR